jgi:DNA-binding GntR family transcriptional regulator
MGLIAREPNRSAVVTNVTEAYLHSMFEAMAELEAICARLSAERMTVDERRALELEHRESVRLVHAGAEEEYSAHNTDFHTRLYRGAHNDHVFEMVTQTRARLAPFRRAQFRLPGRLAKSYEEHGRIVTAIMRADAAAAGQAAYSHVEIVSDASAVFATPGE